MIKYFYFILLFGGIFIGQNMASKAKDCCINGKKIKCAGKCAWYNPLCDITEEACSADSSQQKVTPQQFETLQQNSEKSKKFLEKEKLL